MDHIYKNVYIGNSRDAHELTTSAVLNVAADLHVDHDAEFTVSATVGLNDRIGDDMSEAPCNCRQQLELAVATLTHMAAHNRTVLVHCHEGVSRSVTVVALWLVREHGFSLNDALVRLRDKRGAALERILEQWPNARIPHPCHITTLQSIIKGG